MKKKERRHNGGKGKSLQPGEKKKGTRVFLDRENESITT